jgi:hypothetical protein
MIPQCLGGPMQAVIRLAHKLGQISREPGRDGSKQ